MVHIALQLKAALDGVTNLRPAGDDFRWYIKLKCLSCGEETKSFVYLTLLESVPLKGGRGSASIVAKCKLCGRENSVDIMKDSIKSCNIENCTDFKSIVTFECRGMEPTEFSPRADWLADAVDSSMKFEIDLTEQEWYDFDEKASKPVSVTEIEYRFSRA